MTEITPSDEQNAAIKSIIDWFENEPAQQEFFLDGEAGTGKSSTAQIAVNEIISRKNIRILQAAYTAKAALVMRQKGASNASTIHRLIYRAEHDENGKLSWRLDAKSSPIRRANLLVIDEVSMVSERVAADLRSFGVKILVLGDVDGQLPPIHGEGAFTRRKPDFKLRELNRFAMEDPINILAQRARHGGKLFPSFSEGECRLQWLDQDAIQQIYDPDYPESQIICGRHKVRWAMTRNIRRRLYNYEDPSPRVGEKILCRQNNYALGILNGQMAVSTYVHDGGGELRLLWGDDVLDLDPSELESNEPVETSRHLFDSHYSDQKLPEPEFDPEVAWWDFGYVITAHSSQGSEWEHVTIIDDADSFKWSPDLPRRWRYTAITRASKGLTMFLRK